MKNENKYWFCVRCSAGSGSDKPGAWVARGPYNTGKELDVARLRESKPGMDVTGFIAAKSADEAVGQAHLH